MTVIRAKAERGSVQNAILALLAERPRHGYELRDLFEAALGGHWELNSGQIYSSLDRLARDGLVVEERIERADGTYYLRGSACDKNDPASQRSARQAGCQGEDRAGIAM